MLDLESTQAIQFAQAMQLVSDLEETRLPIILAGDFNSDAEPTANYLPDETLSYYYIAGSGFVDAWHELHPDADYGYTWPLFFEDPMSDQDLGDFQERIDLIFSNELEVVSIEKIGADPVEGLYASDHAGVVAEYELARHCSRNARK